MKKINYFLTIVVTFFLLTINVKANSINDISMDIKVGKDGVAHVIEIWNVTSNSGTEIFKPYYNIGKSQIENFTVSLNDNTFEYSSHWNTSLSFNDKAYKNGINYISNGLELCFGISKYGTNNYKMEYDITNFVAQLNDSDMIYWTLINSEMNPVPKNVSIKIYSDFKYNDSTPIWGYGNYGDYAYVTNGYIQLATKDQLISNEYMTVLAKFPKGTFDSTNVINKDFDYYFTMAENGSNSYPKASRTNWWVFSLIYSGALIVLLLGCYIGKKIDGFFNNIFLNNNSDRFNNRKIHLGNKSLPKNVNYSREIPSINIYDAYFIASKYRLMKKNTDFFGVLLLKWLMEKKISIVSTEEKKIFRTVKIRAIKFEGNFHFENDFETELWRIMYNQADSNGILKEKVFINYCKMFYKRIFTWFEDLLNSRCELLISNGKGTKQIIDKKVFFGSNHYNYNIYNFNDSLYDDALKLKGLKKFLYDFSIINKREPIEVNAWREYMIFAQLFGIADRVAKAFKNLYPEMINNEIDNYSYGDIQFLNSIATNVVRSSISAKNTHERAISSYSSGGGGGGSFGGSSGGSSSGGSGGGIR